MYVIRVVKRLQIHWFIAALWVFFCWIFIGKSMSVVWVESPVVECIKRTWQWSRLEFVIVKNHSLTHTDRSWQKKCRKIIIIIIELIDNKACSYGAYFIRMLATAESEQTESELIFCKLSETSVHILLFDHYIGTKRISEWKLK